MRKAIVERMEKNPTRRGSGTCLHKYRGRIDSVLPLLARNFDDWLALFLHASLYACSLTWTRQGTVCSGIGHSEHALAMHT